MSFSHRLSIEPQNIEELTELRDYKSQVPEKLIALKKVIEEAMRNYGVRDELCYKLPAQDFQLRWDLYAWPKKITDECVELEEKCIRLENKQQIEMEEVRVSVWKSTLTPSTPWGAVGESPCAIDAAGRLRGSRRWRFQQRCVRGDAIFMKTRRRDPPSHRVALARHRGPRFGPNLGTTSERAPSRRPRPSSRRP